jgi:hypothetical protein
VAGDGAAEPEELVVGVGGDHEDSGHEVSMSERAPSPS